MALLLLQWNHDAVKSFDYINESLVVHELVIDISISQIFFKYIYIYLYYPYLYC